MSRIELDEDIVRLTNRQQAKLLGSLKPLNLPEIAIVEIKRRLWYLAKDINNQVLNKGNYKDDSGLH